MKFYVFPADAGVILGEPTFNFDVIRLSRRRGGDPNRYNIYKTWAGSFPQTRG